MSLSNREIADIFERCADMLQIRGDNIHRVLSYRRASETIRALSRDLRVISSEGGLTDLSYIGKTIAAKIDEMLETGELEFYNRLKAEIPEGLVDIMHINGVGPKKAKLFWERLDITSAVDELQDRRRCRQAGGVAGHGRQEPAERFSTALRRSPARLGAPPSATHLPAAQAILDLLLAIAGSAGGRARGQHPPRTGDDRRCRHPDRQRQCLAPIMDRFVSMENVARVLGHGPTKSSVELLSGLQVDVRVLEKARWGTALNYFTGSLAHNVKMRQIALDQGLSLNEHALSPVDENKTIIETRPRRSSATAKRRSMRLWLAICSAGTARGQWRNRSGARASLARAHHP